MRNENYITIQGWMVNELSLSGNDLICYALIYGFTQNGEFWEKSQKYISEWLGISRRSVVDILKRLTEQGMIEKIEYEVNGVKFCKYRACVKNFIGCEETSQGVCEETSQHRNNNNNNKENEIDKSISKKKNETSEFIDYIYHLYPTTCPCRSISLSKSETDKRRIKQLLKRYTMEDIERVVKHEIEQKYGKSYMSNFSTFLNNFPDPACVGHTITSHEHNNDMIINGVKYR